MTKLTINKRQTEVPENYTVLDAARNAGIFIPTLCQSPGLDPFASCMVCVVKDGRTGKLFPSCAMRVEEGMVIITDDDEVIEARKTALELLLSEHVGDCEAPCSLACPARMNIPLMNRYLAAGAIDEALAVVRETIALPAVLGYVCSAPCESACKRKSIDEAVSICLLKRFSGLHGNLIRTEKVAPLGKTVAVIGAGPAGLAAAWHLQLLGIAVTLIDAAACAGGSLWESVDAGILPQEVLNREVRFILDAGIVFFENRHIDREAFIGIADRFDAVILATGAFSVPEDWGLGSDNKEVVVNKLTFRTVKSNVFAAGSVIQKMPLAVTALTQGRKAADAVFRYLTKSDENGEQKLFNSRLGKLQAADFGAYLSEGEGKSRINPASDELGYTIEEVRREASRCMHCDCRAIEDCRLRTFATVYQASQRRFSGVGRKPVTKWKHHELVVFEPGKCIRCGICVQLTEKHRERYGMTFIGRGFEVAIGVPFAKSLEEGLAAIALKVVEACPTGALSLINKY